MNKSEINTQPTGTIIRMPILPITEVTFPGARLDLQISNEKILEDCKHAQENDCLAFITFRKESDTDSFSKEDIATTGVIAYIGGIIETEKSENGIVLFGIRRGLLHVDNLELTDNCPYGDVEFLPNADVQPTDDLTAVLNLSLRKTFDMYTENIKSITKTAISFIHEASSLGELSDKICQYSFMRNEIKQELLQQIDPIKRAEALRDILEQEIYIIQLERKMNKKMTERTQEAIREKYLRDQLEIIHEELGDYSDYSDPEIMNFKEQIKQSKMPENCKKILGTELDRFAKMGPYSSEASIIRSYLQICLDLPWAIYSKDNCKISTAKSILEKDHYGLNKVKERILQFLAVRILNPESNGTILCLVGPPGTGKTSIASSIAKATGRKFERLSLGGVYDESEIRGHRRTYLGSMPGMIIDAVKRSGVANPVILLDEIDKLSKDYKGDPASALLEVLDPEQNKTFKDHYVDMPFDLSKVLFITTANFDENIPIPLQDRMDIVKLSSYTYEEKLNIAKKYLLPKQLKKCGIKPVQLKISDEAFKKIIEEYTSEGGVRGLERCINRICSKTAVEIIESNGSAKVKITIKNIENYLGTGRVAIDKIPEKDSVGIVTGLAYTEVGGAILPIEVNVMNGTGKTEITGNIGNVMKESARAAVSYIRANALQLGVSKTFYKDKDIHIHVPDGATPKDGPSAGCAMATAVLSRLTDKKIRRDIAMTGEVSITGRVLPIGGLKEKTLAAYKAGVKEIIIPADNKPNMEDIVETVKQNVQFHFVSDISQVFEISFVTDKKQTSVKNMPTAKTETRVYL